MAHGHRYTVFAWTVESNLEIPDLLPAPPGGPPDLRIWLGSLPDCARNLDVGSLKLWHSTVQTSAEGRPHRAIWHVPDTSYYLLEYFDGHRFVFNRAATDVWAQWPADSTAADNLCYLLGPIVGILLTLREVTCLHASCVQLGEGCVAVVGVPEAGKSTTAAAFALRGHAVLSDDITTLEAAGGEIMVRPTYPRIRLWPASADVLGVPLQDLPPLTPNWEKRYLDLRGEGLSYANRALPLLGVYVLQERAPEDERPYLENASPRESLLDLITNVYVAQLPHDGRPARDFPVLREVAGRIPVRRVFPHSDPARLPRLCELIEQDVASQTWAEARAEHV
jgi:hypothetical protein